MSSQLFSGILLSLDIFLKLCNKINQFPEVRFKHLNQILASGCKLASSNGKSSNKDKPHESFYSKSILITFEGGGSFALEIVTWVNKIPHPDVYKIEEMPAYEIDGLSYWTVQPAVLRNSGYYFNI